mmetsp:Transcript_9470/g.23144  ORF Transcript_9470/g.23144 Transcript_9470/m.23144 type:complete len:423 (-) Transcript_9470:185-1453(-)
MKLSLTLLVSALGYTAGAKSNPFAPKVSRNNKKNKMNSKLMGAAKPIRRLDGDEEQEVDLTGYSIKFEKCQLVKQYPGEEGGGNDESGSILETKRFIIFRLCPSSSSSCDYNYGEYIVDMATYLEAVLDYKQEVQEEYCGTCNECYEQEQNDDGNNNGDEEDENAWKCQNMDTSTCYNECQNIENMEDNGYVDASEFTECVQLDYEDNYGNQYFAGPMCASSGSRIKIGVFSDEECSNYESDKDIENYMKNDNGYSLKLSYHLLKQTFAENEFIASCLVVDEEAQYNNQNGNNNNNDEEEEAEVNEVCEQLYEEAGKCESSHGFEEGIVDYDNYDNQVRNEELVCDFISSLKAGHFDQTGEIVVSGGRTTLGGSSSTTGGQKFALTFFILGSVGVAGYAAMLHSQLSKGAKADLAQQGGAMA